RFGLVLYPRGHGQPRSIVNCTTRRSMNSETLFGLSILMSFIASGIVMKLYIWPRLRVMRREDALIPLVIPHTFRFVGLSFLIPGSYPPRFRRHSLSRLRMAI